MSTATTTKHSQAEYDAFTAALPRVARLGEWPHFLVVVDGRAPEGNGDKGTPRVFEPDHIVMLG
jgi:hypothetical protein